MSLRIERSIQFPAHGVRTFQAVTLGYDHALQGTAAESLAASSCFQQ